MKINLFSVIIILLILAGITGGVTAGDTKTSGLNVPLLSAISSFGIISDAKTPFLDQLLIGNQEFKDKIFSADPDRYQDLAMAQSPKVLWIGCSDSRSDPERITNASPGELFVTRNVGNIVPNHDWNLITVVEYSINYLKVKEIVIVGHSDCGAIKALDANLTDPYITLWLNDAREAKMRVDDRILKPQTPDEEKERHHHIELENIMLQTEHLMTYPTVRDAVSDGRVQVHGLYYDLSTGTLSKVV